MWKMTLKQRRRHGELMKQLDQMRSNKFLWPPEDYKPGDDPEVDEKYQKSHETFQGVVMELHELEEASK